MSDTTGRLVDPRVGRCAVCGLTAPLREVEFFGDGELFRVCRECSEKEIP